METGMVLPTRHQQCPRAWIASGGNHGNPLYVLRSKVCWTVLHARRGFKEAAAAAAARSAGKQLASHTEEEELNTESVLMFSNIPKCEGGVTSFCHR